jgi:predicted Rossmann-fold nucleotide-binding protein
MTLHSFPSLTIFLKVLLLTVLELAVIWAGFIWTKFSWFGKLFHLSFSIGFASSLLHFISTPKRETIYFSFNDQLRVIVSDQASTLSKEIQNILVSIENNKIREPQNYSISLDYIKWYSR